MSDDDLSQRERRMQRHKTEARKDLPRTVARTYGIWLIVLVVVAGAGYAIYASVSGGQECPGHWHATFEVYVPGAHGEPVRVDMATPRALNGNAYYDLSGGAGMGLAVHMHQSGAEQGSAALGPAQWHFEQDGTCVGVKSALHAIEVDATATSLKAYGGHAQVHQDQTWEANATARLRWFVETQVAGNWTWQEKTWDQVKSYQLPDGASLLVALGDYTDAQVQGLEKGIPPPISRT
ncbi:MAG: hypothetical protein QOI63_406 [Thermoplasmata archaeon]|nr:hypothetical protein [Thermoplasmata archaeon]